MKLPHLLAMLSSPAAQHEPPNDMHFARTGDTAVIVQISGYGPTGTTYAKR